MSKMVFSQGIALKKQLGQHFLRSQTVADHIVQAVTLDAQSSVFEIGCGDGFLTRTIISQPHARFWIFEIDHQWADYISKTINDARMQMFEKNFLDVSGDMFKAHQPWTLLSNLPYQVTFPILNWLVAHRDVLKEGVIMVQEEVAQKITKKRGKGYGYISLFLQHFFEWKLLDKVKPSDFYPEPKVDSRLMYFRPKKNIVAIPHEEQFWHFIKMCFKQPRRTLKNNLMQCSWDITKISETHLALRGQQMSMEDFLQLWDSIRTV